ncbi:MAG: transposase, partial [Actinobacteria bacterium]|nr:transposase [Actinomycetota bacterium]
MIYPLVREMAAPGARVRVPVAVACRVLGFSEQGYYRWLKSPLSAREVEERHLISVLRDLHEDDPEGGYRMLADDLHDLGYILSERRVWRLCKVAGIQTVIAKRKCRYQSAGAPVGDDLVERDLTADSLDEKWLTDITEHGARGRQALPLRDQGRLLEPDRGVRDRPADESLARGQGAGERASAARLPWGRDRTQRPRISRWIQSVVATPQARRCGMVRRQRDADRAVRPKLRSPGHPKYQRPVEAG